MDVVALGRPFSGRGVEEEADFSPLPQSLRTEEFYYFKIQFRLASKDLLLYLC